MRRIHRVRAGSIDSAWVILNLTSILLRNIQDRSEYLLSAGLLGEIAFMLWLVIRGAKPPALDTTASAN